MNIACFASAQKIEKKDCEVCPEMIPIIGGSFLMGADASAPSLPIHEVKIDHNFAVSKFPITRDQWRQFINDTNYEDIINQYCWSIDSTGTHYGTRGLSWENPGFDQEDNHPVVCVTWIDVQRYIRWLNSKVEGITFRLLSEAEWEFIARVNETTSHLYDFGNLGAQNKTGHTESDDQWRFTSPVDAFPPNKYGIYDLVGNTFEWVSDCVNGNYDGAPVDGSAWTETVSFGKDWGVASSITSDGQCLDHITRGLSWLSPPREYWFARRGWWRVQMPFNFIGFRVAYTISEKQN